MRNALSHAVGNALGVRGYATTISCVHTLEPSSDLNLRNFLTSYEKSGFFFLAHGILQDLEGAPELPMYNCIAKRELLCGKHGRLGRTIWAQVLSSKMTIRSFRPTHKRLQYLICYAEKKAKID